MRHPKKIIITGGLGFLGSFFARTLMNNKFDVIIVDKAKPQTIAQKILTRQTFMYENLDITIEEQIKKFYEKLKKKKIKVNYLLNNAAIDSVPKKSNQYSHLPYLENWNEELAVSLTGSYLMIKYFGENMVKNKFGKIVNIGSDLSVIAPNQDLYSDYGNFLKPVTYSVIKHGMLGLTKYFSSLYAEKNVQVNMLSPGPIYNNQNKSFVKKLSRIIPSKRMAKREDLIDTLLLLLNERNSYLTGQNIIVDGGRTII
ncbi:FabG Dehydrogenases with different specificities (related to short-chain alcohol dehydrogenases) [Candidatus Pelagibacterales bacterium]